MGAYLVKYSVHFLMYSLYIKLAQGTFIQVMIFIQHKDTNWSATWLSVCNGQKERNGDTCLIFILWIDAVHESNGV